MAGCGISSLSFVAVWNPRSWDSWEASDAPNASSVFRESSVTALHIVEKLSVNNI